jgi:hypothetical protein
MNAQNSGGDEARQLSGREAFPVRHLPVVADRGHASGTETVGDGLEDEVMLGLVARARRLADGQPEAYRSLAFTTLLQHLLRSGGMPASARSAVSRPAGPPATELQMGEFLAQHRLDSHPDRVVAIAYYHYHRFNGQGVGTKDLVDAYAKSRSRRPQNFPDVIASCVRKGYLIDGGRRDGAKTWVITGTGEAHVEQEL